MQSCLLETGVDKLVNLVKQRGQIALVDAAKELGVSTTVIQEWVDFLEEEGIISIEHSLTKTFLVETKISKQEAENKIKEFTSKKDIFVRKAEVGLGFLRKQSEELKKVKQEFDKLKNELGLELDTVKEELKELEKYQQLKEEAQKQAEQQKKEAKTKIEDLTKHVLKEQEKYNELISVIQKERKILSKENSEAKFLEMGMKKLNRKLLDLRGAIGTIENKIINKTSAIISSELYMEKLNGIAKNLGHRIKEEKSIIDPLVEKSKEQERKVLELQEQITKKIAQKQKNVSNAKNITKKVKDFFDKKLTVASLVDKVNKDRDDLEISLIDLIRKAKSFQLTVKNGGLSEQIIELENKFVVLDKKKKIFELELKKLLSFFSNQ